MSYSNIRKYHAKALPPMGTERVLLPLDCSFQRRPSSMITQSSRIFQREPNVSFCSGPIGDNLLLLAESSHDIFRKSLGNAVACLHWTGRLGGQKRFPNSKRPPCRMRSVGRPVAMSNGTPMAFRASARVNLHSGLENRRTLIAFPGFESLVSRQDSYKSPAMRGFCVSGIPERSGYRFGSFPHLFPRTTNVV